MKRKDIIPPPPPIFWKYTAHLLRRTLKINAQRIKDTPALYFQLTPCICTVYFQKFFFRNIRRICVVTLAKAYILVRFCQRVSAVPKHRYCLIRAASVPMFKRALPLKLASFAKGKTLLLKILNVSKIRLRFFASSERTRMYTSEQYFNSG